MKTVLSIQSQVAGARVGNSIAAFALERLGVQALQIPTTLYGRRPDRGPPGGAPVPAETMAALLDALDADGRLPEIDAVLSGYLAAPDQAAIVRAAAMRVRAANPQALYVCDPVMGDEASGPYVAPGVAAAIAELLVPEADLITPNLWELEALAGAPCRDLPAALAAAHALGRAVLVTSAPSETGVGVLYRDGGEAWLAETPRSAGAPKGAGDLIAALFLAHRLNGRSAPESLEAAAGATYDVIVRSHAAGRGDLDVVAAQALLGDPQTRPNARALALEGADGR